MKLLSLLRWADSYPYFYFQLQGNPRDELSHYRWLMAVGKRPHKGPFLERGWYVGGWSYEWKAPYKKPLIDFPRTAFFTPILVIASEDAPEWEKEPPTKDPVRHLRFLQSSLSEQQFLWSVERLREHIARGEVYQVNLSLGLLWEATIDPLAAYVRLLERSPMMTFHYLFKWNDKYVIGASPERFFWQWRQLIAQQPIKGTIARGDSWRADIEQIHKLRRDPKELAENTMIVDLVRNDLQQVCLPGSVEVPALAEVQTFPALHHLVSTVYGIKEREVNWVTAAASLFPAGSMTGAPKRAAMEYIHRYEPVGRGIYSGALGYLSAEGLADFAVVIRSWVYDRSQRRLLLQVGSGITYDSDPQAEWRESWLKAERLLQALGISMPLLSA